MLSFEITDFLGFVRRRITKHYGGNVVIPVNDSRTASVTIGEDDPANVEALLVGQRMLRVRYDDTWLVFWGVMTAPQFGDEEDETTSDKTVINAHDPTIKLKHRYFGKGMPPVDDGYTVDGPGMWSIVEACEPPASDTTTYHIPGTGILLGVDTTNHKQSKFKASRGTLMWDEFTKITDLTGAPDWNLRPVAPGHPGALVSWSPGVVAEMSFYAYRGVQRYIVPFHDGWGSGNCRMIFTPDFTQVINYAVRVGQGGETDDATDGTEADDGTRVIANDTDSWGKYGLMESWDSGDTDDKAVLQSQADADVAAYKVPPPFFSVVLNPQGSVISEPPKYLYNFTEGDEIHAVKKRRYYTIDLTGRIKQVTLTDDETGNTTTSLDCVPNVGEGDFNDTGSA